MTLIEKVARAQFAAWKAHIQAMEPDGTMANSFDDLTPQERRFSMNIAHAAIEAMRECTDEMRDAAVAATEGPSCHMSDWHCAGLTWEAMINEALREYDPD